jgi:hypothetical protein
MPSRAGRPSSSIRSHSTPPRSAATTYTNECKEITVKTEAHSQDRDREAATGRFPLALFVVAELLCTGALIGAVILWG